MNLNWLYHNYTLDDLINSSSFQKWVQGKASSKQKEYWDQWIKEDSKNRELAKKAQKKIAGFSIEQNEGTNVQHSWDALEKKLNKNSKLKETRSNGKKRNDGIKWALRIAAAVLITAVTGFSFYFYNPSSTTINQSQFIQNEIKTDYNERKQITLSDGSSITLNAHSLLIYKASSINSENIEVFLQGEAFFSVAKRSGENSFPFRVRTAAGEIQVLGTEFVVSTRNSKTRVVLEEGSVAVEPLKNTTEQVLLKPGEMAEFDSSWDVVQTKEVNTNVYTSWKSRTLVFDETPLSEVIDRLEYTFGVHVIVRDPDLFTQRITGSVENSSLEVITSALSSTLETPVRVDENTVYFGK